MKSHLCINTFEIISNIYLNNTMKNNLSINTYGKSVSNTFKTLSDHNGSPNLRNVGLCIICLEVRTIIVHSVCSNKYQIYREKPC